MTGLIDVIGHCSALPPVRHSAFVICPFASTFQNRGAFFTPNQLH